MRIHETLNIITRKQKKYKSIDELYHKLLKIPDSDRQNIRIRLWSLINMNYKGRNINYPSLYDIPKYDGEWFLNPFMLSNINNINDFKLNYANTQVFNDDIIALKKDEYLDFNIDGNDDIFIKAPMGCGKTTAIIRELAKIDNPDMKILVISPRRTITATIYRKFKEIGVPISNYILSDNIARDSKRIIISPNGLVKFKEIYDYDFVIIDEIMLFLEYIFSNHPKNKLWMFLVIEKILKTCQRLICSDAFLYPKVADIFKRYRPNQRVITYTKPSQVKYIFESKSFFLNRILENLDRNVNSYVFCETKKQANQVYKYINTNRDTKIILITADTNNKIAILKDPNKSFINYNIVVVSPIILSGFDFTINHFDEIFGLYVGNLLSSISIVQMSGRIRKARRCYFINARIIQKKIHKRLLTKQHFILKNDRYYGIKLSLDNDSRICLSNDLLTTLSVFIHQYVAATRYDIKEFCN